MSFLVRASGLVIERQHLPQLRLAAARLGLAMEDYEGNVRRYGPQKSKPHDLFYLGHEPQGGAEFVIYADPAKNKALVDEAEHHRRHLHEIGVIAEGKLEGTPTDKFILKYDPFAAGGGMQTILGEPVEDFEGKSAEVVPRLTQWFRAERDVALAAANGQYHEIQQFGGDLFVGPAGETFFLESGEELKLNAGELLAVTHC